MSLWADAYNKGVKIVDVGGESFTIPIESEARIIAPDGQTVYVYRYGQLVDEVPASGAESDFVITLFGKVHRANTTVRVRMHSDDAPDTERGAAPSELCCGGTRSRKGCTYHDPNATETP